jgi:hypothetical protein
MTGFILHFFATFSSKTAQKSVVASCGELEHDCVQNRARQGFQSYRVQFSAKKKESGVGF